MKEPETLDLSEWLASKTDHFTLKERALGTHWIQSWVDTGDNLDAL